MTSERVVSDLTEVRHIVIGTPGCADGLANKVDKQGERITIIETNQGFVMTALFGDKKDNTKIGLVANVDILIQKMATIEQIGWIAVTALIGIFVTLIIEMILIHGSLLTGVVH